MMRMSKGPSPIPLPLAIMLILPPASFEGPSLALLKDPVLQVDSGFDSLSFLDSVRPYSLKDGASSFSDLAVGSSIRPSESASFRSCFSSSQNRHAKHNKIGNFVSAILFLIKLETATSAPKLRTNKRSKNLDNNNNNKDNKKEKKAKRIRHRLRKGQGSKERKGVHAKNHPKSAANLAQYLSQWVLRVADGIHQQERATSRRRWNEMPIPELQDSCLASWRIAVCVGLHFTRAFDLPLLPLFCVVKASDAK